MTELFFLPYAGGSAMSFAPYEQYLDSSICVHYVDLPGHGKRIDEPFLPDIRAAADFVCDEIMRIGQGFHYAIFGHSMGNFLAYEAYHLLKMRVYPEPSRLFLSGRGVPNRYLDAKKVSGCGDEAFLDEVGKYGGLPDELLGDSGFKEYFIPLLRSDFGLIENYKGTDELRVPISCPVTILYGQMDGSAPPIIMPEWSEECRGGIVFMELPGDHFFCMKEENMRIIAERINHDLGAISKEVIGSVKTQGQSERRY